MKILENQLTVNDFSRLYQSAGWGCPNEKMIQVSLEKSYATFSVEEDGMIIGMARLLGDGGLAFYLKDFVIMPEYQGRGIGKVLLAHVENYIKNELEEGWNTCLELMSAKGKEEFYKKFGFEERPTEFRGAGMMKMI